MMSYIPKDFLSLHQATAALARKRFPTEFEAWEASSAEMAELEQLRDGVATYRAALKIFDIRSGGRSDQPPPPWTAEHIVRLVVLKRVKRSYEACWETAIMDLRAALAEGQLTAAFIAESGDVSELQAAPWRTDIGLIALRNGTIPPLASNVQYSRGPAFLRAAAFENWLEPPCVAQAVVGDAEDAQRRSAPGAEDDSQTAAKRTQEYLTGVGGRPSSRQLVSQEMRRRFAAGANLGTYGAECGALAEWLADAHPKAPHMTAKSIQNSLRAIWKSLTAAETPK